MHQVPLQLAQSVGNLQGVGLQQHIIHVVRAGDVLASCTCAMPVGRVLSKASVLLSNVLQEVLECC